MVHLSYLIILLLLAYVASAEPNLRKSSNRLLYSGGPTGGTAPSACIQHVYSPVRLTCTTSDVSLVRASNITILDDGCKFPGDRVRFDANFEISATATPRYDVGIWFTIDGDSDNDGSYTGSCLAATPFLDVDDDACGDVPRNTPVQYPRFQLDVVCRRNFAGKLMLPYCITARRNHENVQCLSPTGALPYRGSVCKCDKFFTVDIDVPRTNGTGSGIGDPHFESWAGQKFEYYGLCDLVLLQSSAYGNGLGLTIHMRTAERNNTSYIESAVIKIGNDKLEVQDNGKYFWNDELSVPLPDRMGDSTLTYVVTDGWLPMWTIKSPRGGIVFVQIFDTMVDVKLSGFLNEAISDSVGLLGDFDSGFLISRTGEWMFDTYAFGNEWQVRDTEPMLFHEVKQPQYPVACGMPLRGSVERRID